MNQPLTLIYVSQYLETQLERARDYAERMNRDGEGASPEPGE